MWTPAPIFLFAWFGSTEANTDCGPGEFNLQIEILTDDYPDETSWEIEISSINSSIDSTIVYSPPYNESNYLYTDNMCLRMNCYDFKIFDSFGDGFSCFNRDCYYRGVVDNTYVVFEGGVFEGGESSFSGASEVTSFCFGDIPTSAPSVSLWPSNLPSSISTFKPSILPSIQPNPVLSAFPSVIPTSTSIPTLNFTEMKEYNMSWVLELKNKLQSQQSDRIQAIAIMEFANYRLRCTTRKSSKNNELMNIATVKSFQFAQRSELNNVVTATGRCIGTEEICSQSLTFFNKKRKSKKAKLADTNSCSLPTYSDYCDDDDLDINQILQALLPEIFTSQNYDITITASIDGGAQVTSSIDRKKIDNTRKDQRISLTSTITQETASTDNQRTAIKQILKYFGIDFNRRMYECTYPGVNCNDEGDIITLNINNCGFVGKTFPAAVATLQSLRMLNFGGNKLIGTIPNEIAELKVLEILWLEENKFTGTIPAGLGTIETLTELNLYDNKLTGPIPAEFGRMVNIRRLDLGKNDFSGSIPFGLYGSELSMRESLSDNEPLLKLEEMFLNGNLLTGFIPQGLFSSSNLISLDLGSNQLSGTIPTHIGDFTQIDTLSFFNNSLTGAIPSETGLLGNITQLIFEDNQLTGMIPSEIGNLGNLRTFSLFDNNLTGLFPTELLKLNLLEIINLDAHNLAVDTISSSLGYLSGVQYLDFNRKGLSGTIPSEIGLLKDLKFLSIGLNMLSGTIPTELGKLSSLQYLNAGFSNLTGPIPSELGQVLELETLDLADNFFTSIPPELGNLTKLKRLDLGYNGIQGTIPSVFGKLLNLTMMNLVENYLTGSLPIELSNLSQLRGLWLLNNMLTGSIPSEIGNLTKLKFLGLGGNELTGTIPAQLGNLQKLSYLWLHENKLTGSIPSELGLIDFYSLFMKNNNLTGFIPTGLSETNRFAFSGNLLSTHSPTKSPAPTTSYEPSYSLNPSLQPTKSAGPTACFQTSFFPIVEEGIATLTRPGRTCKRKFVNWYNSAQECADYLMSNNDIGYYFDDDYFNPEGTTCNGYEISYDPTTVSCHCCVEVPLNCPDEEELYPPSDYYYLSGEVYQYSNPQKQPECCLIENGLSDIPTFNPTQSSEPSAFPTSSSKPISSKPTSKASLQPSKMPVKVELDSSDGDGLFCSVWISSLTSIIDVVEGLNVKIFTDIFLALKKLC